MKQGIHGSANRFSALFSQWLTAISLLIAFPGFGEDKDPSAMWYRAFLTYESCLELEKEGKFLHSLEKCNEAKALYDGLAYGFPTFQPEIVSFKQKIVSDTALKIKAKMRKKTYGQPIEPERPAPPSRQIVERGNPEFPNVATGPKYIGPSAGGTPISPPPQRYGKNNDPMPTWNHDRRITGPASRLIVEVSQEEQRKDSIISNLKIENQKLVAEKAALNQHLKRTENELAMSRRAHAATQAKLEELERQPLTGSQRQVQQLKQIAKDALRQAADANLRSADLLAKLQAAEATIGRQAAQIKQLERERDSLAKIVQGKGMGAEDINVLELKYQKLLERLALLEKVAKRSSQDVEKRERDIVLLKDEVRKVRDERDRLVLENVKHEQQIESLVKKLEMLNEGLSDTERDSLDSMAPEQLAENQLLRSMVLKQLRRQAQLKQGKELLLRQLDAVGARSTALMEVVEDMARGTQFSAQEKALFKSPKFNDLLAVAENDGEADNQVFGLLFAPGSKGRAGNKGEKIPVNLSQIDKAARLDFQEGRLDEAEDGFLRYLHFKPRSVPCLCNLGILKIATENYAKAQQYLQKAIAIDKASGLAHYHLGRTYFFQNKHDDALSHLERGIQLQPNNAEAHNCVGVIASQKGWAIRAEKAFNRAVKIKPMFGDAHFNLAVLFTSEGKFDFEKANFHYWQAVKLKVPRDAYIEKHLKEGRATGMHIGLR